MTPIGPPPAEPSIEPPADRIVQIRVQRMQHTDLGVARSLLSKIDTDSGRLLDEVTAGPDTEWVTFGLTYTVILDPLEQAIANMADVAARHPGSGMNAALANLVGALRERGIRDGMPE